MTRLLERAVDLFSTLKSGAVQISVRAALSAFPMRHARIAISKHAGRLEARSWSLTRRDRQFDLTVGAQRTCENCTRQLEIFLLVPLVAL